MPTNKEYMLEILDYFNMTAEQFSNHSGIAKKTIEGWKLKGVSHLGYIALKNILEVEKNKREFEETNKYLIEKSDDFDRFLEIQRKYLK